MDTALRETQTRFYALDMSHVGDDFKVDDGFNILNLRVKEADKDGSLQGIASTYDPVDQIIRDGIYEGGRKVISFSGVGSEEMRRPVEIEFACNLFKGEGQEVRGEFYLLQIRPIVDSKQVLDEDLAAIPDEQCLLRSHNSLGHGISEDVVDVVYVKTDDDFTAINNPQIADEIEQINRKFLNEDKNYILIGPGRWGSSDYWLGIPVKWPHISAARVIVEAGLKNYHVDPSQGTHFFQNLTSFGVGYFTINTYTGDGVLQKDVLDQMPAVEETQFVRHVRFERPLKIMMDGKKQHGVVLLPTDD